MNAPEEERHSAGKVQQGDGKLHRPSFDVKAELVDKVLKAPVPPKPATDRDSSKGADPVAGRLV
jgi:hypothetical protein